MLNLVNRAFLVLFDNLSYASLVLSIFMVVMILLYVCLLIAVQLTLIFHFPRYKERHFLSTEARIYLVIVNCLRFDAEKRHLVRPSSTKTIADTAEQARDPRPALNIFSFAYLKLILVTAVTGPLIKKR